MIPKLYSPGYWFESPEGTRLAKTFVGVLSDVISCKVTRAIDTEHTYSLEMTYPLGGACFKDIKCRAIIIAKPDSERSPQMFEIYRITTPISGMITVFAKHISYMLASMPAPAFDDVANAENSLIKLRSFSNLIMPHGFTFSIDPKATFTESEKTMTHEFPTSIRAALFGSEESYAEIFGCEFDFDNLDVIAYDKIGKVSVTSIKYGVNMTEFEHDENITNIYTGIFPYAKVTTEGADGETITNVVTVPSKIIYAFDDPDYKKVKVIDLSNKFVDASGTTAEITPANLVEAAQEYIAENQWGIPEVNIKVSFAQLSQSDEYKGIIGIEDICFGDTVRVEYPAVGISATARCVKTVYDAIGEKYESVEIGNVKKNIVDTIASLKKEVSKYGRRT